MQKIVSTGVNNPKQEAAASFFQAHFLAKVSPKGSSASDRSCFQINPQANIYSYHRSDIQKMICKNPAITEQFGLHNRSYLIPTESLAIQDLLETHFHVIEANELRIENIFNLYSSHFVVESLEINTPLQRPLLIDTTAILGPLLSCKNEKKRNDQIQNILVDISQNLHSLARKACLQPGNNHSEKKIQQHISWLFANSYAIALVDNKQIEMKAIQILPLFPSGDKQRPLINFQALINFLTHTGLGLGFIDHLKAYPLQVDGKNRQAEYAVGDLDTPLVSRAVYKEKEDLLKTQLFKELLYICGIQSVHDCSFDLMNARFLAMGSSAVSIMLKATLLAISSLLKDCPENAWQDAKKSSFSFQIVQLALYRIFLECATIRSSLDSQEVVLESLESIHNFIFQLLEILHPYEDNRFDQLYQQILTSQLSNEIPVRAGLGKSAVNISAALAAAAWKVKPSPYIIYSDGFYYEQAEFIGGANTFSSCFASQDKTVDLYMGQFYSNIDLNPARTLYATRDIASDIHLLLSTKKASKHLTIAIDTTIDRLPSDKVHHLLEEFQTEIMEGKLNFVIFQSGVKFCLFGMDNTYAAPFFIVNNGDAVWQHYNAITESAPHKTDSLTKQYYTLLFSSCFNEMNLYRDAIFGNTKHVLANLPKPHSQCKIIPVNDDFLCPFIDVKVKPATEDFPAVFLRNACEIIGKGVSFFYRPSFGFYHPNITLFSEPVEGWYSIRITPGIDPKDAGLITTNLHALSMALKS